MADLSWLNLAITAGTGLVGVAAGSGLSFGVFKTAIESSLRVHTKEISEIKDKQRILRGEDGLIPLFMSRNDCLIKQGSCASTMCRHITEHAKEIKTLNNFARWFMQERGLKLDEINDILDAK